MSILGFDRIAAARGDGLRPELRALLERRALLQADSRITNIGTGDTGRAQDHAAAGGLPAFLPGNVVPLRPQTAPGNAPAIERTAACTSP